MQKFLKAKISLVLALVLVLAAVGHLGDYIRRYPPGGTAGSTVEDTQKRRKSYTPKQSGCHNGRRRRAFYRLSAWKKSRALRRI